VKRFWFGVWGTEGLCALGWGVGARPLNFTVRRMAAWRITLKERLR
jgi:hypothetical protein